MRQVEKSHKRLTGVKDSEQTDIQITDLDPGEVSLTKRPAVREKTLMVKSEVLNEQQLAELAKSLNIKVEELTPESIRKAEEEIKKGILPFQQPPQQPPQQEDQKPKLPPMPELDKSVSQYVALAAKTLAPVMSSLPEEIQKYFGSALASPMLSKAEAQAEQAEIIKSMLPGVVNEITRPLSDKIGTLEATVGELTRAAELSAMREVAKSISPDVEGTAAFLVDLKKAVSQEKFDAFVEQQKRLYAAAAASDAFKQLSKSSQDESPVAKIDRLAQEIIAKSENPGDPVVRARALEQVLRANPELAREYERDMSERAASR